MTDPLLRQDMKWLLQECRPWRGRLVLVTTLLALSAVLVLGLVRAVRPVMLWSAHSSDAAPVVAGGLFLWFLIMAFLARTRYVSSGCMVTGLTTGWRKRFVPQTLNQPLATWARRPASEVFSAFESACTTLESAGLQVLPHTFRHALTLVGAVILLALEHRWSGAVLPALLVLGLVPLRKRLKTIRRQQDDLGQTEKTLLSGMREFFGALLLLHTSGQVAITTQNLLGQLDNLQSRGIAQVSRRGTMLACVILFAGTAFSLLALWGVLQMQHNPLVTGDVVTFLVYALLVISSLNSLAESFPHIQKATMALRDVRLALEPEGMTTSFVAPPSRAAAPHSREGLCLNHISFSFPDTSSPVLHNIHLHIPPQTRVAVVGSSGSGKSTLLSLMAGLYTPSQGELLLDGTSLFSMPPDQRSAQARLVPQDPALVTTSLRCHLGGPSSTSMPEEAVWNVLETLDLKEWVQNLPDGLDTLAGPHGTGLSSGQKQRLLLGSLFLASPPTALLDEPLSSLDGFLAHKIQQAILAWARKRTLVMATHRLDHMEMFDSVLFLHKGRVLGHGPHQTLMDTCPHYAAFVNWHALAGT
jgi:ABC-type multidrug transport system fused ATPase/permease subunit